MSVYELTAKELFAWYTDGESADEVIQQGRAEISARLQKQERMDEKDAFYAADRILAHAHKLQAAEQQSGEKTEVEQKE